jgi:cyclopropane fatty-acyl-phospholipid synthase-like methyltransferase
MSDERAIAECFDQEVGCCTPKMLEKKRSRGRALADAIEAGGIGGLSVLEIGSGVGELARELVRRGAKTVDGIDLSPESVRIATAATEEEGLAEVVTFTVANGATVPLTRHDVVVLDRVICCYPNAFELLSHTTSAAGRIYAFKLPHYEGLLRKIIWKIAFAAENSYHALRRRGFRAYLHDVDRIDKWLKDAGFSMTERFSRRGWLHAVYVRT